MSDSLLAQTLGNNAFYTTSYIQDCLTFTKSLLIKNHEEAKLYNEALTLSHPEHTPDNNIRTWRYYHHLQGIPHPTDTPIQAVSIDNGSTFTLTRQSLSIHKKTRQEILKFGLYYDELTQAHPYQQLYIKAVATDPLYKDTEDLVNKEDFTIVAVNKAYIEDNEHDLIPTLQDRINNYKSIWLLGYYQNLDNLYLATQYAILYQFLFTSLLAIRLANAKTMRAHSFHIRLYLASHYQLDKQMLFLSRRQQLYLYRNLLYLGNHTGKNHIFRTLINELFNEHNVSVVNYIYNQENNTTEDYYTTYVYNQKLLNNKNLVYNTVDYQLSHLKSKETPLAPSNLKEYQYNEATIDRKNKNSLISTLLTKDLESILIDETDSVKNQLLGNVTDYWAYLVKHNLVNFLVTTTDPVTNVTVRLNTADAFKLYTICLHATQGVEVETFPTYRIQRVFREEVPTPTQLGKYFFDLRWDHKQELKMICDAIPMYRPILTSYEFGEYASHIYKLNIGLWHLLTNHSDGHTEGQMAMVHSLLNKTEDFTFTDESVDEFLFRTGVRDPRKYARKTLELYTFAILDEVFDRKFSYIKRLKKLQQALTEVFSNFNSYSVQFINNYFEDAAILAGVKDRRYVDKYRVKVEVGIIPVDPVDPEDPIKPPLGDMGRIGGSITTQTILNEFPGTAIRSSHELEFQIEAKDYYSYYSDITLESLVELQVNPRTVFNINAFLFNSTPTDTIEVTTNVETTSIYFQTDINVEYTKVFSEIYLDFTVGVNYEAYHRTQVRKLVPINVSANDDPSFPMTSESSDPILMFLALNP